MTHNVATTAQLLRKCKDIKKLNSDVLLFQNNIWHIFLSTRGYLQYNKFKERKKSYEICSCPKSFRKRAKIYNNDTVNSLYVRLVRLDVKGKYTSKSDKTTWTIPHY